MRSPHAPVLSTALLATLLLAGCSGGGAADTTALPGDERAGGVAGAGPAEGRRAVPGTTDSDPTDAGLPEPDPGAPDLDGPVATGGGADSTRREGPAGARTDRTVSSVRVAAGTALVRTGELTVRVDDVRTAAQQAARVAAGAGGSVQAEERSGGDGDGSALLVLRVPPAAFGATLGRLAELGEELDRRTGTQDVTEQVVDLESRIATQKASVARVRALLDRAEDLGDVVLIEGELTERTADLESLQARLAALAELVDLSTITLRLDGTDSPVHAGATPGFREGLSAGWEALVVAGRLLGAAAGALLPFFPLLLLGGLLVRRLRSRRAASA